MQCLSHIYIINYPNKSSLMMLIHFPNGVIFFWNDFGLTFAPFVKKQDILTDLQAEPETLPLDSPKDDWQGHKVIDIFVLLYW